MRILIADDEYLVRQTLISMLVQLGMSMDWIDVVNNGQELLEKMKVKHYDMAFVDIHMPNINGMKAIEAAKQQYTYTKWVIVTGYSEFEYAKQAIELGVSSYLLKPISLTELGKVVTSLLQENKQYAISLNQQFEAELNDRYRGAKFSTDEDTPWTGNIQLQSFCIEIHSFNEILRSRTMQQIIRSVREKIKKLIQLNSRLICLNTTDMMLTVVGAWGFFGNQQDGEQIIQGFHKKLKVILKRYSCKGLELSLITSGISQTIDDVFKGLHQIRNMSGLRMLEQGKSTYSLQELKGIWETATDYELKFIHAYSGLLEAYYHKKYLAYMGHIDNLERLVKNYNLSNLLESNLKSILCYGKDTDGASPIEVLRAIASDQLLKGKSIVSVHADPIDQVKAYIEKNYMHNIGINQIAEQLHLTPNYLSTLFKKKEGITFMKYLTKTRMLMAKELLSSPNGKVSQVANQVGFSSTRHFSKLFKNYYNMYPSELKQQSKES